MQPTESVLSYRTKRVDSQQAVGLTGASCEDEAMDCEPAISTATVASSTSLVPELLITNLDESLDFWCRLCGFEVLYQRTHEGFAYISRGSAHIMLEQLGTGRNWVTGTLERPLGRGVNFQISVPSIEPLIAALDAGDWPLFLAPETKWYRTGEHEAGVRQFLVADPDGYLIRFQTSLGRRRVP